MVSKALARLNKTMKARNMPTPLGGEQSERQSVPGRPERPSLSRHQTLSKLSPSKIPEATEDPNGFVKTVVTTSIGAGTVPRSTQQWAEALEETNPETDSDEYPGCYHNGNGHRTNSLSRASNSMQTASNGSAELNSMLPLLRRLEAKMSSIEEQLTDLAPRHA